ncbi:hypothetical protein GCM10022215_00770 [Nocardioides fonticola]|uniref:Lipoprotein n=2 Tax=Nocardioides fonticola TaxID=450363 RepID=A0ABP7X9K6_9ACTN
MALEQGRRRAAVSALILAGATALFGGCERQASDTTAYGRLATVDPPCIDRPGEPQACFDAPKAQLTTVAEGDCVEVRWRPASGGGLPPILSIRPIPPSAANGQCDVD